MLLAVALSLIHVVLLEAPLHHVQGIDVEGDTVWVSAVDRATKKGYLYRMNRLTGKQLAEVEVQDGDRFHPGGIMLDGDSVWVPVAEYRRLSSTVLQRRDKQSLRLLESFPVQDHIGCVAVGPDRIYGGNWDSREIYEWDRQGRQLAKRPNSTGTGIQDLKYLEGALLGGGLRAKTVGAIDWLDPKTLELRKRVEVGATDRGVVFTNEGMTIRGGVLYLLPEDDPSRLFSFRLP